MTVSLRNQVPLFPLPFLRILALFLPGLSLLAGCAGTGAVRDGIMVGQEAEGPWWMQQTRMGPGGRLELTSKPWWPRAAALAVGESFVLSDAGGPMLIRRERVATRSRTCEAIVWVIDDNADGSLSSGGDTVDDCYVVDYDADGIVDRLVDYIDTDGDGTADEMDIRYFEGGELRSVWCGLDLDGDGHMWDLKGYEYSANFFASDPYGDNMIYMNKFDPERGEFVPISECPFAFFDTDGDGHSEIAIRVSASPLAFDPTTDPDYANDSRRYRGPWDESMRRMGAMNVRYSFDIDNLSSDRTPLHYEMGFNLVGAVPYAFPGDRHFNAKRRPPQVTRVIPHDRLRAVCDTYPAAETGFTWHEQHDDTITIGDPDRPPGREFDFRWEGVFWIWERRFMSNTGGPCQKWNVRREWSDRPSNRRRLYYSEVDRRIHLYGAREGWIQIGHFAGMPALGEIRMFDTDGNGYFDRWEVYTAPPASAPPPPSSAAPEPVELAVPARVTTVRDERVRDLDFDYAALHDFYVNRVLPEAMDLNERFLVALQAAHSAEPPSELVLATLSGPPNMRRYAQDVLREWHYQRLRQELGGRVQRVLAAARMDDLRPMKAADRASTPNSSTAWQLAVALAELDVAYGQGELDRAAEILKRIAPLAEVLSP